MLYNLTTAAGITLQGVHQHPYLCPADGAAYGPALSLAHLLGSAASQTAPTPPLLLFLC